MSVTWFIAIAIALGLLVWAFTRRKTRRPSAKQLWRRLRKLTHDPLVADRLVSSERKRHPEMDEAAVIRRVIQRLERDRR